MKLQFIGATRTVTGSMHHLIVNNKNYLLDCGLYQGKRKEAFEINRNFNFFDPSKIECLILSHAHIDHCGNIPNLVKKGFSGDIYCTPATKDLITYMLKDSAHIQEKDVEFVNKRRKKQGKNPFEPLYVNEEVEKALELVKTVKYRTEFKINDDITIKFFDAGHILGSAVIHLTLRENLPAGQVGSKTIKLGFSGDLGRPNLPILKDPETIPDVDYWISESTYGGRLHDKIEGTEHNLAEVINKAVSRKAKIIVPAFSVGRTQELVYAFNKIFEKGLAKEIPIYVDSPLAVNVTSIFRKHTECFDKETIDFMNQYDDPFGFNKLTYINSVEESKRLNDLPGPMMIISASGMAEAGRILHHLSNNIENPNNIILMVGYCAENTLGRKIMDKEKTVKIFGEEYHLNADVIVLHSMSAHADADELTDYCKKLNIMQIKKVFLVHGDYDQQQLYSQRLKEISIKDVEIPMRGDLFEL
jgi:metallo-beta-lactamase family protein